MAELTPVVAGAIVALVVSAVVVGAVVYWSLTIHGSGQILAVGLDIYEDAALTKKVDATEWGQIPPGGYSQVTLYGYSNSTAPTYWTLSTQNWQPPIAENYMILSWDYDGSAVSPGEIRAIVLTLAVDPDITGVTDFGFDMTVTAHN